MDTCSGCRKIKKPNKLRTFHFTCFKLLVVTLHNMSHFSANSRMILKFDNMFTNPSILFSLTSTLPSARYRLLIMGGGGGGSSGQTANHTQLRHHNVSKGWTFYWCKYCRIEDQKLGQGRCATMIVPRGRGLNKPKVKVIFSENV